jgi:metal-dependent amidase/aminoacylase/carboxypeptidase family protein
MDALTMTEDNTHLTYMSKRPGFAHMCGHDGHVACLVAFAWKYLQVLDKIP